MDNLLFAPIFVRFIIKFYVSIRIYLFIDASLYILYIRHYNQFWVILRVLVVLSLNNYKTSFVFVLSLVWLFTCP